MTWTPSKASSDVRPIVTNLLAFFAARQTEALNWANGGTGLADFTFYPNAEMLLKSELTTTPHFGIIRRTSSTDYADDGLRIIYTLTWQFEVKATYTRATRKATLATLQAEIDKRAYALESMFLNIPDSTLYAGLVGTRHGYSLVSKYDPIEMSITETEAFFNVQQTAILVFTETP